MEDLEEAIKAPANVWERVGERIMDFMEGDNGGPIGMAIAAKIMGVPLNPQAVALAGFPPGGQPQNPNAQQAQEASEQATKEETQASEFDMTDEQIMDALGAIHSVVPLSQVLPLVSSWIKGKNPEEVNKALGMIKMLG